MVVAAAFWQLGVWNSRAADDFGLAVLVEAAVILSGLTALQLAGYRLSAGASRPAAGEIDSPIPQFTILQLMLATAVVAAMVAGLVHVSAVPLGSRANDGFSLVVGAYFAGVTLASLLAALLFQHAAVPVAAVVVASAALGLAVALAMRDEGLIGPAMLLMGATAMVETAAFGLLRRRGYRLQRSAGPSPSTGDGTTARVAWVALDAVNLCLPRVYRWHWRLASASRRHGMSCTGKMPVPPENVMVNGVRWYWGKTVSASRWARVSLRATRGTQGPAAPNLIGWAPQSRGTHSRHAVVRLPAAVSGRPFRQRVGMAAIAAGRANR